MPGLFETFNIAKLGMNAQQTSLQVVSHNVANSNTEGYSVQRANLKTAQPFPMPSLNSAGTVGQLGTGVLVDSITRSRDEFLDAQIQKETSTFNMYKAREQFLSEIESIFTEPSDTGISKLLADYWEKWDALHTTPESGAARKLLVSSGEALATGIRHNYQQLCDMETNAAGLIEQQVFEASSLLKQISDLNTQIKSVTIAGQTPNDLMDKRDLLLDKLSERCNFDVDKTEFNGISVKLKVYKDKTENDRKSIDILSDTSVNKGFAFVNDVIIKNDKGEEIKLKDFPTKVDGTITEMKIELFLDGDKNKPELVTINKPDADTLKKYLNIDKDNVFKTIEPHVALYDVSNYKANHTISSLQPINFTNGSLKGYESINHEINVYKDELNNMTKVLIVSVNTLHSNSSDYKDSNDFYLSSVKDPVTGKYISLEDNTKENFKYGYEAARYIAVNEQLKNNPELISAGLYTDPAEVEKHKGSSDRALLIANLRKTRLDILSINDAKDKNGTVLKNADGTLNYRAAFLKNAFGDSIDASKITASAAKKADPATDAYNLADGSKNVMKGDLSKSSIDNYFTSTIAKLGVSNQEAKKMVSNQKNLLSQIIARRESVSGVSLDEEVTNMIQFQRSYQANAKMISVIDELLNVLVNGLIK